MRAPGFWWRRRPGFLARLLQPLGMLYGAITLARMGRRGAKAGIRVICVGNFVAGGAGKTPTAIAIAMVLGAQGETPFVLMRGYGGRLRGPVRVDPERHSAADVGDEALLMAAHHPTIVARDRPAGAERARTLGASVVVMDDGLQNPSLVKDRRLAVVDGGVGIGNGLCVPAGPLRAPLTGQLAHAEALIVIGGGAGGDDVARIADAAGLPVLRARLEPAAAVAARLADTGVITLCAIGRPQKFEDTLREAGASIIAAHRFGDHHAYTAADIAAVLADAKARDCLVATTEKDMTKLAVLWPAAELHRLVVVPVTLVFERPGEIEALLLAGKTA